MDRIPLLIALLGWPGLFSAAPAQDAPAQFRAEVDQVVVYSAVYDRENNLVPDLVVDDFTIFEDKVRQEITYFGLDDIPATLGVVIDTSGSMRDKFDRVDEATRLFLSMNNPENELFLVSFKDDVSLEEGFTREVEDIYDALDNVIISGGTALYDAIYLAIDQASEGSEPKRAVLVFTDGEDKDSYYSHEDLIDKVEESDVQVYIIAFLDSELSRGGSFFGLFKSEREKIEKAIRAIPEETGGQAFFPEQISQLKEVFASIAQELRNQYRLAYISTNPLRDGKWRKLDVLVRDSKARGFKVRAKKGYRADKRPLSAPD